MSKREFIVAINSQHYLLTFWSIKLHRVFSKLYYIHPISRFLGAFFQTLQTCIVWGWKVCRFMLLEVSRVLSLTYL